MGNSFSKRHRAAGHKQTQAVKKNERTRRERFLYNKMKMNKMMLAAAFVVMAFGAASVSCDMHEAVVENVTDAMMNMTMNATDAMANMTMNATAGNATEDDHDRDHDGEAHDESTDDAGTDGGEASEDDSRRKLFQFEALQDAAMNAAANAQEIAMNVGGRINETLQNVGGALNETVNRVNETVQGGLDR